MRRHTEYVACAERRRVAETEQQQLQATLLAAAAQKYPDRTLQQAVLWGARAYDLVSHSQRGDARCHTAGCRQGRCGRPAERRRAAHAVCC